MSSVKRQVYTFNRYFIVIFHSNSQYKRLHKSIQFFQCTKLFFINSCKNYTRSFQPNKLVCSL